MLGPLLKCCSRRVQLPEKTLAMFRHGEKHLMRDFDIVKIIKAAKLLEVVVQSLLTGEQ